jgi:hypothetical protein
VKTPLTVRTGRNELLLGAFCLAAEHDLRLADFGNADDEDEIGTGGVFEVEAAEPLLARRRARLSRCREEQQAAQETSPADGRPGGACA